MNKSDRRKKLKGYLDGMGNGAVLDPDFIEQEIKLRDDAIKGALNDINRTMDLKLLDGEHYADEKGTAYQVILSRKSLKALRKVLLDD